MKTATLNRGKQLTAVLVALLACLVACALAVLPQSAYAANSGSLTTGTVETSAVKAPAKGAISSIASKKAGYIIVNAKAVAGASGYQFRIGLNPSTTVGEKIKTTTARSFTFANCAQGYKYYAKVRAYKVVKGKKVFGAWSALKAVKVKSGSTSSVCKSRMRSYYELLYGGGYSASTIKAAKARGIRLIALVKDTKFYLGTMKNGSISWNSAGPCPWTPTGASKGTGKKAGYKRISMTVSAGYLIMIEDGSKYIWKRF